MTKKRVVKSEKKSFEVGGEKKSAVMYKRSNWLWWRRIAKGFLANLHEIQFSLYSCLLLLCMSTPSFYFWLLAFSFGGLLFFIWGGKIYVHLKPQSVQRVFISEMPWKKTPQGFEVINNWMAFFCRISRSGLEQYTSYGKYSIRYFFGCFLLLLVKKNAQRRNKSIFFDKRLIHDPLSLIRCI